MKIKERENICFDLLRKLPQKLVLIGGYAASSFDFPRFSVDLDLVIRPRDVREFSKPCPSPLTSSLAWSRLGRRIRPILSIICGRIRKSGRSWARESRITAKLGWLTEKY